MGIFSWLFPSPADRIAKAQRLMADERFAEARLEVIDVEDPAAEALRTQAEGALVTLNLNKALEWARAGDENQVNSHLDLAEQMHDGSMTKRFEEVAAQLEQLRHAHVEDQSWKALKTFAQRRKKLGTDPGDFTLSAYAGQGNLRLFFGGIRPFNLPSLELEPHAEWFVSPWMVIPASVEDLTNEEEKSSLAAFIANSPSALHDLIEAESKALARALLYVAGQRPELAVEILMTADQENALVKLELGRAACALGDHVAANLAFSAGIALLSPASLPIGLGPLIVATHYWGEAYETAFTFAQAYLTDQLDQRRLFVLAAIAANQIDIASESLMSIDEADEARPQLEAFLSLQSRLKSLLEAHPALLNEEAQNTPAWHEATEAVVEGLQETLDEVMGHLKEAEEHMPAEL